MLRVHDLLGSRRENRSSRPRRDEQRGRLGDHEGRSLRALFTGLAQAARLLRDDFVRRRVTIDAESDGNARAPYHEFAVTRPDGVRQRYAPWRGGGASSWSRPTSSRTHERSAARIRSRRSRRARPLRIEAADASRNGPHGAGWNLQLVAPTGFASVGKLGTKAESGGPPSE